MTPGILKRLFEKSGSTTLLIERPAFGGRDLVLVEALEQLPQIYDSHMSKFQVNRALESISKVLAQCNTHFTVLKPWLYTGENKNTERAVFLTIETCRITALLAQSVLPDKTKQILDAIQVDSTKQEWSDAIKLRDSFSLTQLEDILKPIFPKGKDASVLSREKKMEMKEQ